MNLEVIMLKKPKEEQIISFAEARAMGYSCTLYGGGNYSYAYSYIEKINGTTIEKTISVFTKEK